MSVNYNSLTEEYKKLFQEKINFIGKKLEETRKEVEKLHDEKFKPVIEELYEKYEELKKTAFEKKINEIKKQIIKED